MPIYFFDTRDGDKFSRDDLGIDFPDLEAAKFEATMSLPELARNVIAGSLRRELVVEVRDARGPVLTAMMRFEAEILRPN